MTDEEELQNLRNLQKACEEAILTCRKRIAQFREKISVLEPKVTAACAKKEWEDGEPAREALRQTPEFQKWREDFFAKENLRMANLEPVIAERKGFNLHYDEYPVSLISILVNMELAKSNKHAKRMIAEKSVKLDGILQEDVFTKFHNQSELNGKLLTVGKFKRYRIEFDEEENGNRN